LLALTGGPRQRNPAQRLGIRPTRTFQVHPTQLLSSRADTSRMKTMGTVPIERESTPRLQIVRSSDSDAQPITARTEVRELFTSRPHETGFLSKRRLTEALANFDASPRQPAVSVVAAPELEPASCMAVTNSPVPQGEVRPFVLVWAPLPGDLDQRIIATIHAPMDGVSAQTAYREKEHQLGAILAMLTVADAQSLHRRLTIPASDDPVAAAFARLTKDRRDRLVQFLADARRRAAQNRSRR
jgi:hypothetical protein